MWQSLSIYTYFQVRQHFQIPPEENFDEKKHVSNKTGGILYYKVDVAIKSYAISP